MSDLDGLAVNGRDFSASAAHEDKLLFLRLTGNADMSAKEGLDGLLPRVHAEAQRLGVAVVAVDFRELEFMNSSCFKSFVTWISEVQELEPAKQYQIRFLSKPEMHWQRRSLHALRCFAVDLITVET
ncbi:hypothetical protein [Polyangium aurulentum]|uniref:hypothetical protein n=1 Tax=Polyangium aurulentum TaxID=2567896 RepID=UPI0010AE25AE|nr:hypothetical protein [Polyangium aurulentum]UQA59346.1 hypothetical protein E8A73_002205 [Polyangium aurulentum]